MCPITSRSMRWKATFLRGPLADALSSRWSELVMSSTRANSRQPGCYTDWRLPAAGEILPRRCFETRLVSAAAKADWRSDANSRKEISAVPWARDPNSLKPVLASSCRRGFCDRECSWSDPTSGQQGAERWHCQTSPIGRVHEQEIHGLLCSWRPESIGLQDSKGSRRLQPLKVLSKAGEGGR